MKILVTGATGLLGKAVVQTLHDNDIETRSLVHTTAINRHDNISQTEIVWGDITRLEDHADYVKGCDAVIHCAWNFVRGDDVEKYAAANIDPAVSLMKAAAQAGIDRFITISSVSVYGLDPADNGKPYGEDDHFCSYDDAMDVYPRAKQQCETALIDAAQEISMPLTIIRPGLLYSDSTAPVKKMIKGKVALIAGWGNNHLPYIHVDSVSDLIVRLLQHSPQSQNQVEVLNAVPAHNDTCRAVFRRWKNQQNSQAVTVYLPIPAFKALALAPYTIKKMLKKNATRPNAEYQTKTGTRNVGYCSDKSQRLYGWVGY